MIDSPVSFNIGHDIYEHYVSAFVNYSLFFGRSCFGSTRFYTVFAGGSQVMWFLFCWLYNAACRKLFSIKIYMKLLTKVSARKKENKQENFNSNSFQIYKKKK